MSINYKCLCKIFFQQFRNLWRKTIPGTDSSTVLIPGYLYTVYFIHNIFTCIIKWPFLRPSIYTDHFSDIYRVKRFKENNVQLTIFQILNNWLFQMYLQMNIFQILVSNNFNWLFFRYCTTEHFSDIYNDLQCFRYITTDHFSDAVRDGRPRPTRLCLSDHLCSGHSNPKRRPIFPIPALKP